MRAMAALWTIRNRMVLIAVAAILAIALLGGIQFTTSDSVKTTTEDVADLRRSAAILSEARIKNIEMLLAAMDSIIDKAEGSINPERQAVIREASTFIQGHLAEIARLATRAGAGNALLGIERRGFDIELSGPLLLVSILAPGFSEAVEQEAARRSVEVEVSEV